MVGMCTGISFALCSPGSPPLFPLRTCSSPPLMSHLIQSPKYHWDLFIRASIALGPSEGACADEHPFFQVGVLQGLFDWDLLYERFDPLCGLFPSLMLSSAGVAPLPPGFHKLLSVTVTTFAALDVPSWWRRQLHVVCAI